MCSSGYFNMNNLKKQFGSELASILEQSKSEE
jgi:hypothetical protein